jgi:hypothetical protein
MKFNSMCSLLVRLRKVVVCYVFHLLVGEGCYMLHNSATSA